MSSEISIKVEKLSKCYQIYDKPRDRLKQFILPRLRRLVHRAQGQYFREFWALKDVSFEVRKGETIGIIGRNGSGKSTLLQVLCGTLNPSSGTTQVRGRIAALLELGAGFNPEFTGRENIYMNAAVLGLTRPEIDEHLEEIIAFADIGEYLEQPVKTYSSGMYMRLAFSIAVAVEPDILVVDEALSVGDIAFQNKCMARIREMSEAGATILFVSHDLSTTQVICDRVIWMQSGHLVEIGDPVRVAREYYIATLSTPVEVLEEKKVVQQQNTGLARFQDVSVKQRLAEREPLIELGGTVEIQFSLEALEDLEPPVFGLSVYRGDGDWLIGQTSRELKVEWSAVRRGDFLRGEVILNEMCLAPGVYRIALAAYSDDLRLCYGMTGMLPGFTVHADFPTWGKIIHPITWRPS